MPIPRLFGAVSSLPNHGSLHQTPASLMIDVHWASLGLIRRWTWERFVRLANFLQLTPWELASMAMIKHPALEGFKRRGILPIQNAQSTALILTQIEASALKGYSKDIIENPWPKLSQIVAEVSDVKEPAEAQT